MLDLYEHNQKAFEEVAKKLQNENAVSIIHATGTGKSYVALSLALANKDKNITYLVPSKSIIEHIKEIISNSNLSLEKDFPNLKLKTYQHLTHLDDDTLKELDIDILILDEFHHIGAPVWGSKVNYIIDTHKDIKLFGMTAYTVRDRGTVFERDMINPKTDEIFSNTTVSTYDLCDAMIDGILLKPIYKSAYVFLEDTYQKIEKKVIENKKEEYKTLLKDIKRRIHEAKGMKDLFKENIKPNGKYIYFCPFQNKTNRNDIKTIMEEVREWISYSNIKDYELYITTSSMGPLGKQHRDAFYNDKDLEGNDVSSKLRIMFSINQYNEGVHVPGLDGIIMGRATQSDIVFFEQLGRVLSVSYDKKEYAKLLNCKKETLYDMCLKRDLNVDANTNKNRMIELLLSPVIIDLTNNISYIKELENNLKDRVKEIQIKKNGTREIHLGSTSFDVDLINEELFQILEDLKERLNVTWEDNYELAVNYFKSYGNLKIPGSFKTKDGITYDEAGIRLGNWLRKQREAYKGYGGLITKEQINLLNNIGMVWDVLEDEWQKNYEIAAAYYKHNHHLKNTHKFKTKDGITYDKEGISLGDWLNGQRQKYKEGKLSKEKIELLNNIGIQWSAFEEDWMIRYELAKKYYEHYHNIDMVSSFKTKDGVNYDSDGIALGTWIVAQRKNYKDKKLSKEKIELLNELKIKWNKTEEVWMFMYALASNYYHHYKNLDMPYNFRTKNGVDYEKDGYHLSNWVFRQKKSYHHEGTGVINEKQIELLNKIGINWEVKNRDDIWNEKYALASNYYHHYGNLNMDKNFKTKDGITYDEDGVTLGIWVLHQRFAYQNRYGREITQEQIDLLNQIGMDFVGLSRDWMWQKSYQLAYAYYIKHGNLDMEENYKTEDGYNLALWIKNQRSKRKHNKLTDEQIKLLDDIGMTWNFLDKLWYDTYSLIKKYYDTNGNINVPKDFKTKDGITYDSEGVSLPDWLNRQRASYAKGDYDQEKYKLLSELGLQFDRKSLKETWNEKYELLKKYYDTYGNVNMQSNFKTKDGITYDEDGVTLGLWLLHQRKNYKQGLLNEDKINKLKEVEVNFELRDVIDLWYAKYELAKKYKEHYGHLRISKDFKTKDGITYDSEGYNISNWISAQRGAYHGKSSVKMTEERKRLLDEIGMDWEEKDIDKLWEEKYLIVKKYYDTYGNIKASKDFKTKDGINYDSEGFSIKSWFTNQRKSYQKGILSIDKIKRLEELGMVWYSEKTDFTLQQEIITEKNLLKKQKEILSRFYSVLSSYDELPKKEEISNDFIKKLTI